ncbi:pyridoxal phosphate-dependent aminotransferase [Nocardia otitidiscaviarum]|uniref:Pyridoxal phosphate-dependent aminotransferase n=1 Tax=Nocardia otitidiscaviarum TaxID=1823 RepID=A0A516NSV5_9NOCA|nr:pyridoxal phosphate-dependent aminotransferase [Nocardia otitidiscaviarum]MBF6179398.1 pyridoxal phosphate-dependent aminotransferase [Nocardia otitidiscaviarum]MCP9621248.1 pyridoxal phosphate-dependent aminotransferase [Nocardia otitidiscaviarum]QDP81982.1 pyridoxal phosphate-dependent aminotransferase [Nocardia otitidiscaviarum]
MPYVPTVERLRPFGATIFAEMTELAVRHGAINLGQGFPDSDGPAGMLEVARQCIADGLNQYPPGRGMPVLRRAIAADRARRYGTAYDPDSQVLVTVGATEAIAATILGLVEPGREVVLIEPYYDSYAAAVALAGAKRRTARLVPDGDGFALDLDSLRAAITPETRMLLVNSPHNPTGTVLGRADLTAIAELAVEHDLIVMADEAYEHLAFDGHEHISIATLPGMFERTVVISSAAKTFSVTGWKIGWACAPAPLLDGVLAAKQFLTFVGGGPFQPAVAHAIEHEQRWVAVLRDSLADKRLRLSAALAEAGFAVKRSDGTYFVCADITPLGAADALAFCRELPARLGVVAVPVSVFADDRAAWNHLVRFAFCKRDETLEEGVRRLRAGVQVG